VGVIAGGISVNTVPDDCVIEIDRRVLPGEDPLAARQHIIEYLEAKLPRNVPLIHEPPFIASGGLADGPNAGLARALQATAQQCGAPGEQIGVPYGTDAPAFHGIGCPTVVFGPGSIAQAHTCDEWVAIDQLRAATEVYYQFGRRGLA
jgi:acetylornithine deacetylase